MTNRYGVETIFVDIGRQALVGSTSAATTKTAIRAVCLVLASLASIALPCLGQQATSPVDTEDTGKTFGDYKVHQSLEFGYRYNNIDGNLDTYGTFVNLRSGLRLFDESLSMQSLDHNGTFFDSLSFSNFGYGGDPNNMTRLRIEKNRWYNFSALFRRDKNFWDYNLLANPLNPPTSTPAVNITTSPHSQNLVRRMSDFQLTLLPQSAVRVRLGYSNNTNEGPSFSTVDAGTIPLLSQNWRTSQNDYRFGFDFLGLPKTRFSYDQFISAYKQDTSQIDNNLNLQLADGTPVDLGIIWNTLGRTPCSVPFANGFANPSCNGVQSYIRTANPRTFFPTEQFSFQSSYIPNVTASGRFSYSTADSKVNDSSEYLLGLTTRTNERQITATGPADTRRISASADFSLTWSITSKVRLVDTFYWDNFRLPGKWNFATMSLLSQGDPAAPSMLQPPAVFNDANCPRPFDASTCPQHVGSAPDLSSGVSDLFFGQDLKRNEIVLEYDFTPRFTANVGYRYENRKIRQNDAEALTEIFFPGGPAGANRGDCALTSDQALPDDCVNNGDGTFTFATSGSDGEFTDINSHTLLLGFSARPMDKLRINFDTDFMYADRAFMRISPRQRQHYRANVRFNPVSWANVSTNFDFQESRNNVSTVNYLSHNRAYSFGLALQPAGRYSFDLGYTYNDILSQEDICYFLGFTPAATPCPLDQPPDGNFNDIGAVSFYKNTTHSAYGDLRFQATKRISATLGYMGIFNTGNTLFLNPLAPFGPLRFTYQKPYASLTIGLSKGFAYKAGWNYYGYDEKSQPGLTGSRNFNGNSATASLLYSF
jgi:hypothetical protein